MAEENLGLSGEGSVDPLLGSGAAGLADDSAKVTFGETHAIGVVADLMLLATVLVDELDKAVEDGLLA
jgi:hypothetical protein